MEMLYEKAANILNEMIPEAWNKILLYTEVSEEGRKVYIFIITPAT